MQITVGNMVDFDMPSEVHEELASNSPPPTHFYYGGKYVVTQVTHNITGSSGLQTTLELSKNALDNPMPDFDRSVLVQNLLAEQRAAGLEEVTTLDTPNFARASQEGGL